MSLISALIRPCKTTKQHNVNNNIIIIINVNKHNYKRLYFLTYSTFLNNIHLLFDLIYPFEFV